MVTAYIKHRVQKVLKTLKTAHQYIVKVSAYLTMVQSQMKYTSAFGIHITNVIENQSNEELLDGF